ncbi:transporter substrate-binding domain-containing protein [Wielerella bovis]|uniref:substrate-binding periplasmic protein n=1 Tax=Wielerella bovis TaxID=2917790 RepID=UPI0020188562|nr:transporter substrate-binding domain-containing protein [Wielerella bovis]MCG7657756.1 transporter substrate-binding domain-containing protein [Wielerella bovis]MCG7659977.1 transporter substrate-binding domain-containing protein [Wielerella bovis]ULJ64391.1 transporter substrate-binding domain-containing protein [Wielerella bovis]
MKKTLSLITLTVLLAACSDKSSTNDTAITASKPDSSVTTSASENTNAPILHVRIAATDYAPFNIFNADRTFSGIDTDILEAIAKDQGLKLKVEPYIWEAIFTDMQKDKVNLVAGGLVAEDLPSEYVTHTQSYMVSKNCVVAANQNNLSSWQSNPIVLFENDELGDYVTNVFKIPQKNITVSAHRYDTLRQIATNQAHAAISDCTILKYYVNDSLKDFTFAMEELPPVEGAASADLVFAIRKDDTEMLQKVNSGLENIKKNGQLDEILKKWQQ